MLGAVLLVMVTARAGRWLVADASAAVFRVPSLVWPLRHLGRARAATFVTGSYFLPNGSKRVQVVPAGCQPSFQKLRSFRVEPLREAETAWNRALAFNPPPGKGSRDLQAEQVPLNELPLVLSLTPGRSPHQQTSSACLLFGYEAERQRRNSRQS